MARDTSAGGNDRFSVPEPEYFDGSEVEVTLAPAVVEELANICEAYYYHSKEDAYQLTVEDSAILAMKLRERARIEPNPFLLEESSETSDLSDTDNE